MNSKIVIHLVSIILLAIIQSIFTGYIRIRGIAPDFLLVFVISTALLCELGEGALIGLIVGFILDILQAGILGINALIFMYFGLAIGAFNKKLYKESVVPAILFVAAATFVYNFYIIIVMFLIRGLPVSWDIFLKVSFMEMIYNGIATLIIHPIVIWLYGWIDDYSKVFRRY